MLDAGPLQLLPAPGAGLIIEVFHWGVFVPPGGTAWSAQEQVNLGYANPATFQVDSQPGFFNQANGGFALDAAYGQTIDRSIGVNQPLQIQLAAPITGGDKTMTITLLYVLTSV